MEEFLFGFYKFLTLGLATILEVIIITVIETISSNNICETGSFYFVANSGTFYERIKTAILSLCE